MVIHSEGAIEATNALVEDVEKALKKVLGPNLFMEKEQWNVVHMKEELPFLFVAILQIIYQVKKVTYCSN